MPLPTNRRTCSGERAGRFKLRQHARDSFGDVVDGVEQRAVEIEQHGIDVEARHHAFATSASSARMAAITVS